MCGKPFAFPPAINGVLGNTQMLDDVFGSNPWFNTRVDGALPLFVKVAGDRFKSTSRALVKQPFAVKSRGREGGLGVASQSGGNPPVKPQRGLVGFPQ